MQFRESILPGLEAADRVTAILDLAPVQAAVVTRKWSRGQMKRGTPGETEVRLPEWITVKAMSVREIAQSGGRFEVGDLKLGPLRPKFGYGGFTLEELDPSVSDGYDDESAEYFYRVRQTHREGAAGAEWILLDFGSFIVHVFTERARHYYALERLWRTARRTDFTEPGAAEAEG